MVSVAVSSLGATATADQNIVTPPSSIAFSQDHGLRAHTNHLIFKGFQPNSHPMVGIGGHSLVISGYYPSQIRSAYGDSGSGQGVIAIVDAYNYPSALKDFNVFAGQFGLPQETSTNVTSSSNRVFQVVYASGRRPSNNGGWAEEEALDIEWAHSMAPSAKIVLVEASSASYSALFQAVDKARSISGVTQISMSWGGSEFSGESSYDSHFPSGNITYFAATGDTGGVQDYPALSPQVVGCGGTSLTLNGSSYGSETGWSGSGGGPSSYYSRPAFQNVIQSVLGNHRGAPDVSAVADPYTGCAVYDSTSYQGYVGWLVFGGTSLATPICAGLANAGGANRGTGETTFIYANSSGFHDVTSGTAGSFSCTPGWDFVTGWGSPKSPASF